jgi:cytochrome b6-f complex iron-sulfur subunit
MDRKEFLGLVGKSIFAITLASFLDGCTKNNNTPDQPTVDFTLDLTNSSYSALKTKGGYIYNQGVIVAKTLTGEYIAVSQACTHQGVSVVYQNSIGGFYCREHGASFSSNGAVTLGPANSNLKSYTCTLSGTSLNVKG